MQDFITVPLVCALQPDEGLMSPKMNVLTVGNAIVDIFARCEDEFLNLQEIGKGMMNLVDAARSAQLYAACLLYTSPSPRDLSTSRMPSSA